MEMSQRGDIGKLASAAWFKFRTEQLSALPRELKTHIFSDPQLRPLTALSVSKEFEDANAKERALLTRLISFDGHDMGELLRNIKKQRTRLFDTYKIPCDAYKNKECELACDRNEILQCEFDDDTLESVPLKCCVLLAAQNDQATIRLDTFPFNPPATGKNSLLWWLQEIDISSIHLKLVNYGRNRENPWGTQWSEQETLRTKSKFKELFPRAIVSTTHNVPYPALRLK